METPTADEANVVEPTIAGIDIGVERSVASMAGTTYKRVGHVLGKRFQSHLLRFICPAVEIPSISRIAHGIETDASGIKSQVLDGNPTPKDLLKSDIQGILTTLPFIPDKVAVSVPSCYYPDAISILHDCISEAFCKEPIMVGTAESIPLTYESENKVTMHLHIGRHTIECWITLTEGKCLHSPWYAGTAATGMDDVTRILASFLWNFEEIKAYKIESSEISACNRALGIIDRLIDVPTVPVPEVPGLHRIASIASRHDLAMALKNSAVGKSIKEAVDVVCAQAGEVLTIWDIALSGLGGAVPYVKSLLREHAWKVRPPTSIKVLPDGCAAIGAEMFASNPERVSDFYVRRSYSIQTGEGVCDTIVKRGNKAPVKVEKKYGAALPAGGVLFLTLYAGQSSKTNGNTFLSKTKVTPPLMLGSDAVMLVALDCGADGRLNLTWKYENLRLW
jgi:hypothetical protein